VSFRADPARVRPLTWRLELAGAGLGPSRNRLSPGLPGVPVGESMTKNRSVALASAVSGSPRNRLLAGLLALLITAVGRAAEEDRSGPAGAPRRVLMRLSASGEVFAESGTGTLRKPFSSHYRLEWLEEAGPFKTTAEPDPPTPTEPERAGIWRHFLVASRETTIASRPAARMTLRESHSTIVMRRPLPHATPARGAAFSSGGESEEALRTEDSPASPPDREQSAATAAVASLPAAAGQAPLSPGGPLTADELEIVSLPFDPLLLDGILAWYAASGDPADHGPRELPRSFLPGLLGLDTVEAGTAGSGRDRSDNTVGSGRDRSDGPAGPPEAPRAGGVAASGGDTGDGIVAERIPPSEGSVEGRLRLRGVVRGAVRGAFSRIGIEAVLVPEADGAGVASALITVREDREAGFTAPGFESDATVVVSCRRLEPPFDPAAQRVLSRLTEAMAAAELPDRRLAWHDPAGRYVLRYEPRWSTLAAEGRSLRLRLVDAGALVAEATITPLPAAGPISLEKLRGDVRSSLGDRFAAFDSTDERERPDGTRLLRVVAATESGSRRFRESHFVLAGGRDFPQEPAGLGAAAGTEGDPGGQESCLAVAVVVDGSLLERFGEADLRLVEGITLERGGRVAAGSEALEP
jgi:hypothetical protein